MNTIAYRVHDLTLAITAEENVRAALDRRLGRFPAAGLDAVADLSFRYRSFPAAAFPTQPPPAGARPLLDLWRGTAAYSDNERRLHLGFAGQIDAVCEPDLGEADIRYAEPVGLGPAARLLSHPVFTVAAGELLKRRGLYPIRATGLGWQGDGVLLAGPPGSGKSTLAVALLRAGFDYLGDDLLLLRRSHAGVEVRAFPDAIEITPESASFFPELNSTGSSGSTESGFGPKRSFDPTRLYRLRPCWSVRPTVLVCLAVGESAEPRFEMLGKGDALLELMPNILRTDRDQAQFHLDALAAVVGQCLCVRLHLRHDGPAGLPAVTELLRAVLTQARIAATPTA